ncbi:MAG: hypothetical protein L6V88_00505 [Anaerotruncus sp.]|nr:MAG: hypothetical protein L6V88_00505 [Anaerotruncus sp.]
MKKSGDNFFVILFVLTLAVPAAASAAKSSGGRNELVTIFFGANRRSQGLSSQKVGCLKLLFLTFARFRRSFAV